MYCQYFIKTKKFTKPAKTKKSTKPTKTKKFTNSTKSKKVKISNNINQEELKFLYFRSKFII